MSFRLRIFLLVLVVAVTATGATAYLTISLTSREAARVEAARDQHEAAIVDEIRRFGIRHGQWAGVDAVVRQWSRGTGLHIRVETVDGEALTDSDNLTGRAAGPVKPLSRHIDPMPPLDPLIVRAAEQAATASARAGEVRHPAAVTARHRALTLPELPGVGFGPLPRGEPDVRALYQLAQYRAAQFTVRCLHERDSAYAPAFATVEAPYLDEAQLAADPSCVASAVNRVRDDQPWLRATWESLATCRLMTKAVAECLTTAFSQTALRMSAVPVEVYFGAPQDPDVTLLGRPAGYAVAGVVVAAALGTAWIARRVSRPVRLLTGASLQLAAGRLDVRVPHGGAEDELAALSASFNSMAEALQRSEDRQRRLVADVAHELRTPLSNLRGYLEGLADGVIEPSPELFASLHEETLLQRRILDDLQVLALAEAGELAYAPAPVDLSELAATAATAHAVVAANAGVELVADAPEPVVVHADPDRTRQVVGNLLSNAIRYTDAGGRVEIRVRRDTRGAMLSVRDTGVGMTAEEVARVFDRFWRADPARQRATGGSGLGLTIARRIVADQGGTLSAASAPALGTTFTVRFPPAAARPRRPGAKQMGRATPADPAGHRLRQDLV